MKGTIRQALGLVVCMGAVSAYAQGDPGKGSLQGRPYSPNADLDYPTQVYFGDTHVHTGLSADAGGSGTTLMPRDAYRYARGDQIISNTGQPVKIRLPLDFYMVTDHSDAMGVILDIIKGTPEILADPDGKQYHEDFTAGGQQAADAMFRLIAQFSQGKLSEKLNYQPGNPAFRRVWDDTIRAAEEFNDPGDFTTFIAFEWTSLVQGNNLHRNVIFRDGPERAGQIEPYTTTPPKGSPNPRDLWKWLQAYEDKTGGDVLAIPHNGNLSNGMMFALQDDFDNGAEFDAAYAKTRNKWERLYEVTQMKGDGETHPLFSPDDEFADFETWDVANLDFSAPFEDEMIPGSYARPALMNGLKLESTLGANPFKFGMVGGADTHVGFSSEDNDNFFGKYTSYEPSPDRVVKDGKLHVAGSSKDGKDKIMTWQYITSGVTAIWATENTRGALFDAMEKREVYGTTGPRIRVRFFAGWGYEPDDVHNRDLAHVGYAGGVPMGSDLTPGPDGQAPRFLVYAMRDPMGANLDRIQVVKGWLNEQGEPQERVYDVAVSGDRTIGEDGRCREPVGDTVDLSVPGWTNTIGASELGTVWTDPDFDPELQAFYYARILEIPTPRWTAYDRVRYGVDMPGEVPLKQQQRAYTSPIWYKPGK